jgi:Stage II sporulation protein E (SpoIIE)
VGANNAVRKTSLDIPPIGERPWLRHRARRTAGDASRTSTPARRHRSPHASTEPRPAPRYGAGAIATVSAVLVYFLATTIEIAVIQRVRPGEMELTWVSDAVLAVAFGFVMFLWLHLKWTRMTLSRIQREHIVLNTQLSLAAEIQRGLLPSAPADGDGLRWAARLVQAGQIGGDLYDFVRCANGSWLVLVGDVSGKGVPAALVLTSIRTMFRMMTSETSDPGELVERISKRLYEDHAGTPYLTCLVVRIDSERRELAYVNAGHPAGIVLGGRMPGISPLLLAPCGPPAGLFPKQAYRTAFLPVPDGAVSILVTDGITEAFDVLGLANDDPVTTLVAHLPQRLIPTPICNTLIDQTAPAMSSDDWQDDRTVVAFAVDGPPVASASVVPS